MESADLLVIMSRRDWICASCGDEAGKGRWLTMDDAGPLCMGCAELDHLVFLPSGEAALTRRARKHSRLSAVMVQWSRTRKRYERQGLLVEEAALEQAERECLADLEARRRRREREAESRQDEDRQLVVELTTTIQSQFPGCPDERAERIARHTAVRRSGRIGRTAAGRALDPAAVQLAVIAAIRHQDTRYDDLLMQGIARAEARDLVRDDIDRVLDQWRTARDLV